MLPLVNRLAISPLNRLKVLGMRISGWTSIVTPFWVRSTIYSLFCLLSGLSSKAIRHWWVMSGRTSLTSLPCFVRSFTWSSLLSNSIPRLVWAVSSALFIHKHCQKMTGLTYTWSSTTRRLPCSGCFYFLMLTSAFFSNFSAALVDLLIAAPACSYSRSDISKLSSSDETS